MAGCDTMQPIKAFYANKSVFITGGFGFVGKLVVEKLLRACPDISNVYLLGRSKKNRTIHERLEELLQGPVFKTLRALDETRLAKVKALEGELTQANMGLKEDDVELVIQNVNVVFHCAASIRFDEPLDEALRTNYFGTKNILELAKQMQKLEAFVHISTAYANCDQKYVDEISYPVNENFDSIFQSAKSMDASESAAFVQQRSMPNTYTFSKKMAEQLVHQYADKVPITIVRPSAVGAPMEEPFPGYVDHLAAPTTAMYIFVTRLAPLAVGDGTKNLDIVPGDVCANIIIAASVRRASLCQDAQNPPCPIYNCTADAPVTLNELRDRCQKDGLVLRQQSSSINPWPLRTNFTCYVTLFNWVFWGMITVPAWVRDMFAWVQSRPVRSQRSALKLKKILDDLQYFAQNEWTFSKSNVKTLEAKLCPDDRAHFRLSTGAKMNNDRYYVNYLEGLREYLAKRNIG